MNHKLLDFLSQDQHRLRRVSATNRNEHIGLCPFCKAQDQFHVWPVAGKYCCQKCGKSGDAVQYLQDFRGMDYQQACETLGVSAIT